MNNRVKKNLYFALSAALLLTFGLYLLGKSNRPESTDQLIFTINSRVLDTMALAEQVPGLEAHEFSSLKTGISKTWKTLIQNGEFEIEDTDSEVRPYFVALQAIIEHVLSCALHNDIKSLIGIIHTPMPATPLCTKGEVSKYLVDPAIENDPKRWFTVKARTTTLRDFLYKGGSLYSVYPKEGMAKRTELQQSIYHHELNNFPNHLLDRPLLSCSTIPDELIGATYLFNDQKGDVFVFAIKITQAKDPKERGRFGLWFGSLQNKQVSRRVNAVFNFLEQNGVDLSDFELSPSISVLR